MTRIKKSTAASIGEDQAHEAALAHAKAAARLKAIEAAQEQAIAALKAKTADEVAALKATILETFATLQLYAEAEREALFSKAKSLSLNGVRLGFRNSPPKTATRKGFTWASILENLKLRPDLLRFIRIKEEVNKEAILQVAEEGTEDLLNSLRASGIEIKVEETFFVEAEEQQLRPA